MVDLDADEVYLGELNPRISGASSMTNVTAGAYADIPLFLFHLLEYMDVDYTIDVDEINERWRELAAVDVWSQLVMKEPSGPVELILSAPRTGQYKLETDGRLTFMRPAWDWHGPAGRKRILLSPGIWTGRLPFQGRGPGATGHQGTAADR